MCVVHPKTHGFLFLQDDLQGLAHFCEHLLFMGTEKYPKENDYNQYLAEHSGFSNAFTGVENTNYYFEIGHEYLGGALDRFAQFFISPLFSASCTERELRAVDSGESITMNTTNIWLHEWVTLIYQKRCPPARTQEKPTTR